MYTSDGQNVVKKGYVASHIPEVVPLYGANVFWGEDPGNIIEDIMKDDEITKLTQ